MVCIVVFSLKNPPGHTNLEACQYQLPYSPFRVSTAILLVEVLESLQPLYGDDPESVQPVYGEVPESL